MSSSESQVAHCSNCQKPEDQVPAKLQRCARCQTQQYCSRDCQQAHWKTHKRDCRPADALCWKPKANSASERRAYLHDRPEEDVYMLLVDAYRIEPTIKDRPTDKAGALRRFRDFLEQMVQLDARRSADQAMLPPWWSREKLDACVKYADTDGWADISRKIGGADVNEHYKQSDMSSQLGVFMMLLDGSMSEGQISLGPGSGGSHFVVSNDFGDGQSGIRQIR